MNFNELFDGFIKGPLTSLLGFAIMVVTGYLWFTTTFLSNWQAGVTFTIGFALLFMRDKLPGFISKFVNKKLRNK